MKNIISWIIFIYILHFLVSCSGMNDVHDEYLRNGEILYVGRVDSVEIYPGNERFMLRYWITDPRSEVLKIYWSHKQDSAVIQIPAHNPLEPIDIIVGDAQKKVLEGQHTFQMIASNGKGIHSILFEKNGNVYGQNFASTLLPRGIRSANYNPYSPNSTITIDWEITISSREIGIELSYFNLEGEQIVKDLSTDQVGTQTILDYVDITRDISYKTLYLPETSAIDTFFTGIQKIVIPQPVPAVIERPVFNWNFESGNMILDEGKAHKNLVMQGNVIAGGAEPNPPGYGKTGVFFENSKANYFTLDNAEYGNRCLNGEDTDGTIYIAFNPGNIETTATQYIWSIYHTASGRQMAIVALNKQISFFYGYNNGNSYKSIPLPVEYMSGQDIIVALSLDVSKQIYNFMGVELSKGKYISTTEKNNPLGEEYHFGTSEMAVGSRGGGGSFFDGIVYWVRIYDEFHTEDEMKAVMENNTIEK